MSIEVTRAFQTAWDAAIGDARAGLTLLQPAGDIHPSIALGSEGTDPMDWLRLNYDARRAEVTMSTLDDPAARVDLPQAARMLDRPEHMIEQILGAARAGLEAVSKATFLDVTGEDDAATTRDAQEERQVRNEAPELTVYTTPECPGCKLTKNQLAKNGIDFREIDVTTNSEARAMLAAAGFKTAPVIQTPDGEMTGGYRPDRIKAIINSMAPGSIAGTAKPNAPQQSAPPRTEQQRGQHL